MQGITGIAHVAVRTADLDASLAFYTDRLGFEEMMRLNGDGGELLLVYLRITDTQYIEIFPNAVGTRSPGPLAMGMNHLCLEVDDLDAVVGRLAAAGVGTTIAPKMGLDGNRQAWIEDPDGNRIELMQMSADCMQLQAIRRLRGEA